jgi:hypothetical protein
MCLEMFAVICVTCSFSRLANSHLENMRMNPAFMTSLFRAAREQGHLQHGGRFVARSVPRPSEADPAPVYN